MQSGQGKKISMKRRRFMIKAGLVSMAAPAILATTAPSVLAQEHGEDAAGDGDGVSLQDRIAELEAQLEGALQDNERLRSLVTDLLIQLGELDPEIVTGGDDEERPELADIIADLRSELDLESDVSDEDGESTESDESVESEESVESPESEESEESVESPESEESAESEESDESAESPESEESAESEEDYESRESAVSSET